MVNINSVALNVPGVYVNEGTIGAVNADLADHANVYMIGVGATGATDVPILVQNLTDFTNIFGASLSTKSVRMYFSQRPGRGLNFINISKKTTRTIALSTNETVEANEVFTLSINGFAYTVIASTVGENVIAKLGTLLKNQAAYVGSISDGVLRLPATSTVTASSNLTLGSATVPSAVGFNDIQDSLSGLDILLKQGFVIAPEFYESFSVAADRDTLFQYLEGFVSDPKFNWIQIADVGLSAGTETDLATFVQKNIAERVNKASPRGHSWLYTPYIKDSNNAFVPYSAYQAAIQVKAMLSRSFFTPAAGKDWPLAGGSFVVDITEQVNGALYERQINCGRNFKDGTGYITWGVKTLSTSSFYVDTVTRMVLNVIARTARDGYREFMFNVVEGFYGVTLNSAAATGVSIVERVFRAGGLFGATSQDAYLVVCDDRNNTPADLQNGRVHVMIAVKTAPAAQYWIIDLVRASLDTVLVNLFQSAEGTNAEVPVEEEGQEEEA